MFGSIWNRWTLCSIQQLRVSQLCLHGEWLATWILTVVLGSNLWCLVPAEMTGVTERWAHEFSSASSVNAFVRFRQRQRCCRMYQGLTERLSSLWPFRADFICMACQGQQPPADLQEVLISPSALAPLSAGGGSAAWCLFPFWKEKSISSVTPEKAH